MKNHNHASPLPPRPETLDAFLDRHDLPKEDITKDKVVSDVAINALVSRLSREEARAERLGIDFQTGSLNRSGFDEFLARRDNLGRRSTDILPEGTLTLVIDLNNLKKINDSLGHGAGNKAIAAVANAIKASLREGDTLARIGGDEFVAVVDLYTVEADEVQRQLTEKTQENLDGIDVDLGGETISVSASVGGQYHKGLASRQDIETAIEGADAVMYENKRNGKRGREANTTPDS